MGIYVERFYFKEGFPKVRSIKKKFTEITGLHLDFKVDLHLTELITDDREIAYRLNQSQEKLNYIFSSKFEGDKREAQRDLTSLGQPYFSCLSFDAVQLEYLEENSFYLECSLGVKSLYFFKALMKTMLELGGQDYNYSSPSDEDGHVIEDHLDPYHPHVKRWKAIKKWNEMSAFEKSSFDNKLSRT